MSGRVQFTVSNDSTGTNPLATANFGLSCTSGNWITVGIRTQGTQTISSVTDTLSTSYTSRKVDNTQNPGMALYDGVLGSSGTNAVSVLWTSGGSFSWVAAIEISGVTAFDVANSNPNGTGSTDNQSAAITTAQANEYLVMFTSQAALATYTAANDSAGHTWSLVDGTFGGSGNNYGGIEDFLASSTLSGVTAHITSTVANAYTTMFAAYKVTGAAPSFGSEFKSPDPQQVANFKHNIVSLRSRIFVPGLVGA